MYTTTKIDSRSIEHYEKLLKTITSDQPYIHEMATLLMDTLNFQQFENGYMGEIIDNDDPHAVTANSLIWHLLESKKELSDRDTFSCLAALWCDTASRVKDFYPYVTAQIRYKGSVSIDPTRQKELPESVQKGIIDFQICIRQLSTTALDNSNPDKKITSLLNYFNKNICVQRRSVSQSSLFKPESRQNRQGTSGTTCRVS